MRIYEAVWIKLRMHEILSDVADMAPNLFIAEIGRGLDLLLALTVKSAWHRIRCYDLVDLHREALISFFSDHTVEFLRADSREFDFGTIGDNTILVASQHNIPPSAIEQILRNEQIVCAIVDGELLKGPLTTSA